MDDEVDVPEGAQGDIGVGVEGQPAALGQGDPEAGPPDGVEEGLELAVDLGVPGQVPQESETERLEDGSGDGTGIVAEAPIKKLENALAVGLVQGPVPIPDRRGEAEDF